MINLDQISDQDFDFLMDLTVNTAYSSEEVLLANFDQNLAKKASDYLHSDKYDLEVSLDAMNLDWWDDVENIATEDAELIKQEKELLNQEDNESQAVSTESTAHIIESSLIATKSSGRDAGSKVVVVSILFKVNNLQAVEQDGCSMLTLQWLPELNTLN